MCHAKPPRQDSRHITSAASRFPPFEMARRVGFPAKGIRHISRWTQLLARQLQHTVNTTSHSTRKMLDNSRSSIFKIFKIKGFIFVRTTRYGAYIGVLTYKTLVVWIVHKNVNWPPYRDSKRIKEWESLHDGYIINFFDITKFLCIIANQNWKGSTRAQCHKIFMSGHLKQVFRTAGYPYLGRYQSLGLKSELFSSQQTSLFLQAVR